jgi:hypothetical protein
MLLCVLPAGRAAGRPVHSPALTGKVLFAIPASATDIVYFLFIFFPYFFIFLLSNPCSSLLFNKISSIYNWISLSKRYIILLIRSVRPEEQPIVLWCTSTRFIDRTIFHLSLYISGIFFSWLGGTQFHQFRLTVHVHINECFFFEGRIQHWYNQDGFATFPLMKIEKSSIVQHIMLTHPLITKCKIQCK